MSAETQIAGIAFVASHWPKAEREWLRTLADSSPREAVLVLDLAGTFEAMPLDTLAQAVLNYGGGS